MEAGVEGEKYVGETILSFDKGFSQHPSVSLDRGRWPNITFHQSYLNDRQTLSNKGFFSECPVLLLTPSPLDRVTETDGSKIGKEKERETAW